MAAEVHIDGRHHERSLVVRLGRQGAHDYGALQDIFVVSRRAVRQVLLLGRDAARRLRSDRQIHDRRRHAVPQHLRPEGAGGRSVVSHARDAAGDKLVLEPLRGRSVAFGREAQVPLRVAYARPHLPPSARAADRAAFRIHGNDIPLGRGERRKRHGRSRHDAPLRLHRIQRLVGVRKTRFEISRCQRPMRLLLGLRLLLHRQRRAGGGTFPAREYPALSARGRRVARQLHRNTEKDQRHIHRLERGAVQVCADDPEADIAVAAIRQTDGDSSHRRVAAAPVATLATERNSRQHKRHDGLSASTDHGLFVRGASDRASEKPTQIGRRADVLPRRRERHTAASLPHGDSRRPNTRTAATNRREPQHTRVGEDVRRQRASRRDIHIGRQLRIAVGISARSDTCGGRGDVGRRGAIAEVGLSVDHGRQHTPIEQFAETLRHRNQLLHIYLAAQTPPANGAHSL